MNGEDNTDDAMSAALHEMLRRNMATPLMIVPYEYIRHVPIRTRADIEEEDEIERARMRRVMQEMAQQAFEGRNAPLFTLIPLVQSCGSYAMGMHIAAQLSLETPKLVGVAQIAEFAPQLFLVLMIVCDFEDHRASHAISHELLHTLEVDDSVAKGLDLFTEAAGKIFARVKGAEDEWPDTIGSEEDIFGKGREL